MFPVTRDEFSFLSEQAQALGVPLPPVARVQLSLGEGRELSGIQFGDQDAAVTLVHGAGLNAHTWDTTLLALHARSGASALALDLPGHGDSSWRADADYRGETLAADVATAISALTTGPQLLIGHSLGGMTSIHLAAENPELVRELVLVDIAPGVALGTGPAELRKFYEVIDFDSRDEMVQRALAFGFGGDREATERGVFHNSRIREDGKVEWKHHFARLAHDSLAVSNPDGPRLIPDDEVLWAALERITAPITLVRGTHGYLTDEAVAAFARRLPAASIVEIEAGHNIQENDPEALAELIAARTPA